MWPLGPRRVSGGSWGFAFGSEVGHEWNFFRSQSSFPPMRKSPTITRRKIKGEHWVKIEQFTSIGRICPQPSKKSSFLNLLPFYIQNFVKVFWCKFASDAFILTQFLALPVGGPAEVCVASSTLCGRGLRTQRKGLSPKCWQGPGSLENFGWPGKRLVRGVAA